MSTRDELTAEDLERAAGALAKAGVKIRFDFPNEYLQLQAAWLEDWPDQGELHDDLEDALDRIRRLGKRMRALSERLPEPLEYQLIGDGPDDATDDVPASELQELAGAVSFIIDETVPEAERVITRALRATPQSLRAAWLRQHIPESIARQLMRVVANPEQYGWTPEETAGDDDSEDGADVGK